MGRAVRPAPRRREVAAWCLFDFANSSYTTLIITVAYSVFFREAVVGAEDNRGDQLWGIANFLAMAVVALSSPFLGAVADASGWKKRFLIALTLQTVAATALLATVGPGQVARGMVLYVIATIGFEAGYVFYNAFLPEVSTPATIGRVSGWAWAVGYAGGLLALIVCRPFTAGDLRGTDGSLDVEVVRGFQTSFLIVAAFFLVFALPAFLWLREPRTAAGPRSWTAMARAGVSRVRDTLGHLRQYRDAARFVLASLFFTDGISTIISFSAIYATVSFDFSGADLISLFLVLNVIAFPGAVAGGWLADRIGARTTIILSLVLWTAVVLVGAAATNRAMFWAMAVGAAIGMGSTQAVGRSLMAQLTPPERESEFFGFYVLSGKFASMFGPLLFGFISYRTGSQRLAVLSLAPLFIVGLLLMFSVRAGRHEEPAAEPG